MSRLQRFSHTFVTAQQREFAVSYFKIAGTSPGPVLSVVAGQHGMEHSGPCLLPELMEELARTEFAGTLHVCPCANPLALEMDYEFYPENEDLGKIKDYYYSRFRHYYCPWGLGRQDSETFYNMNRLWNKPGIPGVAGAITRWLWQEICQPAQVILDLHCLQSTKPLIFYKFAKNEAVCALTGVEAAFEGTEKPDEYSSGNLTYQGSQGDGKYAICIEFSQQHALRESEYPMGQQAVRNVMCGMGMLPGEVVHARPCWRIVHQGQQSPVTVSHGGHIRYLHDLYTPVRQGDDIFVVRDIQTCEVLEVGKAPQDGLLCAYAYQPVMTPGLMACMVSEARLLAAANQPVAKLPLGGPAGRRPSA